MRRIALLCVLGWSAIAGANGRPAATSTINFQQGHPQNIAAGMTFGLILSSDGGATWKWMCEKAVGYGGMYDPIYSYSSSGALFATTFDGLKVMRDGCTFDSTPPGTTFVSRDTLGPTGKFYYAAADPADVKIYRSSDDGMTFPTSAQPDTNLMDWWDSLVVAPSDPNRVYLSGYLLVAGNPKVFYLFKSTDGGATFTPMSTENIVTSVESAIDVVGVDPTNPDIVYVKANLQNGNTGDTVYKSTNGGGVAGDATAWTKILTMSDPFGMAFLVRSNGDLIAATQTSGTMRSTAGAACVDVASCAWAVPTTTPPHINCLQENPATLATTHEVWACTHNYDSPGIPGDGYGIMKTTDFVTWTPVMRFQDIQDVVQCPAGTAQHDQCVAPYMAQPSVWCCLEEQLGITSTTVDCTGANSCDAFSSDGLTDGGLIAVQGPKGCCETGGSGAGALLLALGTGAMLYRSRRRR